MQSGETIHEQADKIPARSEALFQPELTSGMSEEDRNSLAPAIEFRNVDFSYEDKKVLDDLSFQVLKGEIKIILSGSGGGKSTILKLVLGLLKPDAGQIFIDGEEITEFDETELQRVRDKIGMVFQEGGLFDSLTVYENVAYRLQDRAMPEEDVEAEVRSLLKFVKLEKEMDKLPSELSGGMRKRVSVARALVGSPMIVLFDEPTVALDPPTSGTICDLIIELRDLENVSSIVVTHEMDVVKYLTSEYATIGEKGKIHFKDEGKQLCLTNTNILMLRKGREIFSGTSTELINSEDPYIQKFIRGTELQPERAESRE
ncbi:MAG TPA: ATP-binding cassette domain-containing protein [Pyrinomonadaceae bacterium]|nr:ATP-binding cassette domain-containing protein [Pyrinomonadaceae bacterium]